MNQTTDLQLRSQYPIGMDFETWGSEPLPTVGLDNYLHVGTFQPLACALVWQEDGQQEDIVVFDFVQRPEDYEWFRQVLIDNGDYVHFAAHNAGFERGVISTMGLDPLKLHIIDSAVISRCMGAGSHLEAAAPQLLGIDKIEAGKDLIKKFSIPNERYNFRPPTAADVANDPDWQDFLAYMVQDARASHRIARDYMRIGMMERDYEEITAAMNQRGWKVDLDAVKEMQLRYLNNLAAALEWFADNIDDQLNLNSPLQLKEWCKARGMHATSFDEEHVNRYLDRVTRKLTDPNLDELKRDRLNEIRFMLQTKQTLGGSSLKKLKVILDTVGPDGILRDQYMHCGAGQSFRTSGRGVQMQNLKRLPRKHRDMAELFDPTSVWTNDDLAENLRQVFTASQPQGSLIVGDFSSVESRGLAYLAGEQWKLDAYHRGEDLYKVLAAKINHIADWHLITDEQRQGGKVGELSCGYGAGGTAVQGFAQKMGIEMSEDEAVQLVRDWRATNPMIVELWAVLDQLLLTAVQAGRQGASFRAPLANDLTIEFACSRTPLSLEKQHPGAKTISMRLYLNGQSLPVLERIFQGCYLRGNQVCYYKPSERRGGDLWSAWYIDPKTKQKRFYNLYGGKLSGILTQSFCRELFFIALKRVTEKVERPGVRLIGQFHDEIVLDYDPLVTPYTVETVKMELEQVMSNPHPFKGFPLAAEVKHDYRYTK